MADGIYIAMSGASARAAQLDAVADNLANAQTPGFKETRPAFETFLSASGAPEQAYVAAVHGGFDLSPGAPLRTGEPLDVMPREGAFLVVEGEGGRPAFTRDGRLRVDPDGVLRAAGRPLLGRSGRAITVPPDAKVAVDARGRVQVQGQEVDALALAALEGPVERVGRGLLAPGQGGAARPVEAGVEVGQLEQSNARPLQAAVELVSIQRSYESALQAIQTYRQMDQRANDIGRVR